MCPDLCPFARNSKPLVLVMMQADLSSVIQFSCWFTSHLHDTCIESRTASFGNMENKNSKSEKSSASQHNLFGSQALNAKAI